MGSMVRLLQRGQLTANSGRHQHQVRFVYGYALDGSTFPCYCLYPVRADDRSFQLMDSATGYISAIPQAASIRCKRIQLTIVLPSKLPLADWQTTLLRRTSCWPYRLPQDLPELRPPSKATFIRLRKRGQSKHILGGLVVNWRLIDQHLWTEGPPTLSREELTRRLFLVRTSSTTEAVYRGHDPDKWNLWKQHRRLVWDSQTNMPPQMTLRMSAWILWGRTNYQAYLNLP